MLKTLEFKSNTQSKLFDKIMRKMNATKLDPYYTSLALLWSATDKDELLSCVSSGVKLDIVEKVIESYSTSEKALIRFGLQCFNEKFDDITLPEVLENLDSKNIAIVKQAIAIRYKL